MTNVNLEREKVKRKIVALLNKTTEAGASEHEAMAASAKAAELMEFYDVQFGELEFQEKNIVKVACKQKLYMKRHLISSITVGIAKLCQCRTWRNTGADTTTFFGYKHDVDIAVHFFEYLQDTAQRELDKFKASWDYQLALADGEHGISVVASWINGFDSRVQGRLRELAYERETKVQAATGTSLVPMKSAEIDVELRGQGIRLYSSKSQRAVNSNRGYDAGARVGSSVSLNHGVSGGRSGGSITNG